MAVNTIDFYKMITVFFDLNFIPDRELKNLLVNGNLPPDILLYNCIPSAFLLALHRPDIVPRTSDEMAIKLISCYAPNVLQSMKLNIDMKKKSIEFVLSAHCKSPDEIKKESMRILCKSFKKTSVVEKNVVNGTRWNLFSKIFYETVDSSMLEIVNLAIAKG